MFKSFIKYDIREFISTFSSLSTAFIDLIPGTLLLLISDLFIKYPYLLLIYPQVLSFRGSVAGILVGRYSTSLHLGVIKPYLRGNTKEFYTLIFSYFILLITGSLLITIFTSIWLILIYHNIPISIYNLFSIILGITFSATIFTLPISINMGNYTFKRGLDPDIILYPFSSTIGDLIITVFFITYLRLYYYIHGFNIVLYLIIFLSILIPILISPLIDLKLFIKEFIESIAAITLASVIVGLTGNIFRHMEDLLSKNPLIYIVYPSLLTLAGDSASIVGSRTSTRLSLGGLDKELWASYITESSNVLTVVALILIGISLYSSLVTHIINIVNILIILSGIVSFIILASFSLGTAYITYLKGLDPDHFINPLTSVLADMISTIILYLILILI